MYKKSIEGRYIFSQAFLNSNMINVFKEVSSAHEACIHLIQNTAKAILLWNIFTIQNNCFLFEYIWIFNLLL